jgi:CRISPR-associated protein Csb2
MPLTVTVEFLTGSYDAGGVDDRRYPEWPPHPARLFCALVAAARSDEERAVLRWLEGLRPPLVVAARERGTSKLESYVVTNEVSGKGGNQTHPGRSNQLRSRSRSFPAVPRVRFVWPEAEVEEGLVRVLDEVARRVPYLGRSTGVSLLSADVADGAVPGGGAAPGEQDSRWAVYEPCGVEESEVTLRVPYPGYLDDLDELFDADLPTWQVFRTRGYRPRQPASPGVCDAPASSVYDSVIAFRFAGLRPQGRLAPRFTESLRRAVLSVAGDDAPEVLHGHGADGRPHVAFLALPDVGGEHADGHLLGLAVAVPELPAETHRAVLRAVLGLRQPDVRGVASLRVDGIGEVELLYQPGVVRPWGANPERWRRGSRRWVTATPVVLDRFPRNRSQEPEIVLTSARMVGLPEPVDLRVSADPLLAGAVRLRPGDLPEKVRGRLFRHVALTFDRPVAGPLLLGAGRYLGVGLLAPVAETRSGSGGKAGSTPSTKQQEARHGVSDR